MPERPDDAALPQDPAAHLPARPALEARMSFVPEYSCPRRHATLAPAVFTLREGRGRSSSSPGRPRSMRRARSSPILSKARCGARSRTCVLFSRPPAAISRDVVQTRNYVAMPATSPSSTGSTGIISRRRSPPARPSPAAFPACFTRSNASPSHAREERTREDIVTMTFDASARRIAEASAIVPGGVNSNFRLGISPTPLVIERGGGPYLHRHRWQPADRLLPRHGADDPRPQTRRR